MMPAMSPIMTEGTITRWKKKEGDAFVAGDVLLQIVRVKCQAESTPTDYRYHRSPTCT